MRKIKRLLAITVGVAMSAALFTGCSVNGMSLLNAYNKNNKISSAELKSDVTIRLSAVNLSESEKETMNSVLPVLDGMKFTMNEKLNQNQDRTASKAQVDFSMQVASMPMDMSIWVDQDSSKNPYFKEIVKMPLILSTQMPPEYAGKPYVVIDGNRLSNVGGGASIDYSKLGKYSKDTQAKLESILKNFAVRYNPNLNLISNLGTKDIIVDGVNNKVEMYSLKLSDASFKQLVRYTVNNLEGNKDAVKDLRDLFIGVLSLYSNNPEEIKMMEEEVTSAFDELINPSAEMITSIDSALDTFDKIRVLGDKGITINYAINEEGYIINENGYIELVLDMPAMNKVSGSDTDKAAATGIYTLGIEFNTDITNINGDVKITIPELNENNSINYSDLLGVDNKVFKSSSILKRK